MYLKGIELQGFKSFADKIDLEFGQGITTIVGPNGSGKSNISDAIRWVLGEQSAKSLRGGKMEDVIFAGTQRRAPLGYAQVSIILDNKDKTFKIDYDKIMTMYKQIFLNPGSFVFTFVGNIDQEAIKPAVLTYLASLPGEAVQGEFLKVPMDIRTGVHTNIFKQEMQNPKASVFNVFSGEIERTQRNRVLMSIFDQILDIVYTEKVREDEGGTYGVSSRGSIARYPENQTILQIMYDTDPAKMEHLNAIVHKELKDIAVNGPREEDFNKVKEFMNKKYSENIKQNSYWLGTLDTYYFYNEDNHSDYLNVLNSITMDDVKEFVKELLAQENEVVVGMMPKEVEK